MENCLSTMELTYKTLSTTVEAEPGSSRVTGSIPIVGFSGLDSSAKQLVLKMFL